MEKTIFVRQAVFAAAQRLEDLSQSVNGSRALDLAEQKITDCRSAGDRAALKFWQAVWLHLMSVKYAGGRIQVVEDEQSHPVL